MSYNVTSGTLWKSNSWHGLRRAGLASPCNVQWFSQLWGISQPCLMTREGNRKWLPCFPASVFLICFLGFAFAMAPISACLLAISACVTWDKEKSHEEQLPTRFHQQETEPVASRLRVAAGFLVGSLHLGILFFFLSFQLLRWPRSRGGKGLAPFQSRLVESQPHAQIFKGQIESRGFNLNQIHLPIIYCDPYRLRSVKIWGFLILSHTHLALATRTFSSALAASLASA